MEDFENDELLGFPVKRNPKQPNGPWARYLAEYGDRCVEADAISANEIRERVEAAIRSHIVQEMWDSTAAVQEEEQTEISRKAWIDLVLHFELPKLYADTSLRAD